MPLPFPSSEPTPLISKSTRSAAVVVVVAADSTEAWHVGILHSGVAIAVRGGSDHVVSARGRGLAGGGWHRGTAAAVVVVVHVARAIIVVVVGDACT